MAKLTLGYSYAFQVLGYYTFEKNGDYKNAISLTRQHLEEYVYDKIWSELSARESEVLYVLAGLDQGKVSDIREKLGLKPNEFGVYRDRLIRKGILNGDTRGILKFDLPFFGEYVLDRYI